MIYKLQKKFIIISTVSILAVVIIVFGLITAFSVSSMNRNLDVLADSISEGGGRFPDRFAEGRPPKKEEEIPRPSFDFITQETPFSTRHFTVWLSSEGAVERVNLEFIHSVSAEDAEAMAKKVYNGKAYRGWISNYRYKMYESDGAKAIAFIDGSMNLSSLLQSVMISAFVLLLCMALAIILIALLSKRVVKPIAESYEKQKQFVTDANHELKTPLTLIMANLDIAESELGKNEWLDDMREEGHRMTELVNQLVSLSRMDEDSSQISFSSLDLSEALLDTVAEFEAIAESRGKRLSSNVERYVVLNADETLMRRLFSILLDNAVKYCDESGDIEVALKLRKHAVLTIENTYSAVSETELNRLFDRFYRADKARSFTGGYGIGLSIAKSIALKHGGDIVAYKKDASHIGFKVTLPVNGREIRKKSYS